MHSLFLRFTLLSGLWLTLMGSALAQLPVKGEFTSDKPESGWALEQAGYLTGNRYDPDLAGWLWLNDAVEKGNSTALNSIAFSADKGLTLAFEFAIWGGGSKGGDGMTAFLFDANHDMTGAQMGPGLGYCKGAGGWLALGLDSLGMFSATSQACGGGTAPRPQSVVIRGPVSDGNPMVGSTVVEQALGQHLTMQRPVPHKVQMTLRPKSSGVGFWIDLTLTHLGTQRMVLVFKDLDFPYPAPKQLRLGLTASTKAGKNVHEIRRVVLAELPTEPTVASVQTVEPPAPAPVAVTPAPLVDLPPVAKEAPLQINLAPPNETVLITPSFDPPQVKISQSTELVFTLSGADGKKFELTQDTRLPIDLRLTVVEPLTLGGTCLGTVRFEPINQTLVVANGLQVNTSGCTVSVMVQAKYTGTIQVFAPTPAIKTSDGTTHLGRSATLVVTE
jgi:hypothetical protein